MLNIMKNVAKILLKRKSFLISSIILPAAIILLFTGLYSNNSNFKVAVVNNDIGRFGEVVENRIKEMEGVTVISETSSDKLDEKLIFQEIGMVITIDEDFSEKLIDGSKPQIKTKSVNTGEIEIRLTEILKGEVVNLATLCNNIDVEKVGEDKIIQSYNESKPKVNVLKSEESVGNINQSVGMILYIIILSAGFCSSFLLEDEKDGTKSRALMGKVSEKAYYGAMGLTFFILAAVPAVEYYIICKVLNFQFGFDNTLILLGLLLLVVLLGVAINVMLTTIIKNKAVVVMLNSIVSCIIFMFSGGFWPFEVMSEGIQTLGSALPIRWVLKSIEDLQMGGDYTTVIPTVIGLIVLSAALYALSIFFTKNKIVLVKEK